MRQSAHEALFLCLVRRIEYTHETEETRAALFPSGIQSRAKAGVMVLHDYHEKKKFMITRLIMSYQSRAKVATIERPEAQQFQLMKARARIVWFAEWRAQKKPPGQGGFFKSKGATTPPLDLVAIEELTANYITAQLRRTGTPIPE